MDERGRELDELRDYGHKLLDELRYPNVISMLQQTITHISGIAEEFSNEADKWHEKYDECFAQNEKLQGQIEDLTAAAERHNQELRAVIDAQAQKIEYMNTFFAKQMARVIIPTSRGFIFIDPLEKSKTEIFANKITADKIIIKAAHLIPFKNPMAHGLFL